MRKMPSGNQAYLNPNDMEGPSKRQYQASNQYKGAPSASTCPWACDTDVVQQKPPLARKQVNRAQNPYNDHSSGVALKPGQISSQMRNDFQNAMPIAGIKIAPERSNSGQMRAPPQQYQQYQGMYTGDRRDAAL